MGWLPGYENDIFISYAHEDNQLQYGSSKGSIDCFEERLRTRLSKTSIRRSLM